MSISYREDFKAWWPDYDHKPEICFSRITRSLDEMDLAVSLCKKRNVAIQAGGHAGFWPRKLSKIFKDVYTFEPEPALFECLKKNTAGLTNIFAGQKALGERNGSVMLKAHVSAGSWRVADDGKLPVEQIAIDRLGLLACDAIFLDIEGSEVAALKGATETIKKFNPVIQVEDLKRMNGEVGKYLKSIGYRLRWRIRKDRVYTR